MTNPRSAGVFAALANNQFTPSSAFPTPFKPTHKNPYGSPVELLLRNIYTYPLAYPQVLLRDEVGTMLIVSEETFDQVNKKKVRVNYPEVSNG